MKQLNCMNSLTIIRIRKPKSTADANSVYKLPQGQWVRGTGGGGGGPWAVALLPVL